MKIDVVQKAKKVQYQVDDVLILGQVYFCVVKDEATLILSTQEVSYIQSTKGKDNYLPIEEKHDGNDWGRRELAHHALNAKQRARAVASARKGLGLKPVKQEAKQNICATDHFMKFTINSKHSTSTGLAKANTSTHKL